MYVIKQIKFCIPGLWLFRSHRNFSYFSLILMTLYFVFTVQCTYSTVHSKTTVTWKQIAAQTNKRIIQTWSSLVISGFHSKIQANELTENMGSALSSTNIPPHC